MLGASLAGRRDVSPAAHPQGVQVGRAFHTSAEGMKCTPERHTPTQAAWPRGKGHLGPIWGGLETRTVVLHSSRSTGRPLFPQESKGDDRDAVRTPVGVLPGGDDDEVGDVVRHLLPEPQ